MCNHIYNQKSSSSTSQRCELQKIFPKNAIIPIDKKGKCIFHSEDVEWKKEHQFSKHLTLLLDLLKDNEQDKFNLNEVVFIALETEKEIGYVDKLTPHSFIGAIFKDDLFLRNITFDNPVLFFHCKTKSINFYHCIFNEQVDFSFLEFDSADYIKEFSIHDCTFNNVFSINYSKNFTAHLTISKSTFFQQVDFLNSTFIKGTIEIYSHFEFPLIIENCNFNNLVDFISSKFEDSFEINNSSFDGAVNFSGITLNDTLAIRGNQENKVFNSRVSFDINTSNLIGSIQFEYVNLKNIIREHLEDLKALEKKDKVIIGNGCIKYRHQTPIKIVSIQRGYHELIKEMANTFTAYFIDFCKINLGVEIVSRSENTIKLFYYSDVNISDKEFQKAFTNTQFAYLHLLNRNQLETSNFPVGHRHQISEMSQFNTLMSLISISAKASFNSNKGNWTSKDSEALFDTIVALKGQKLEDPKIAHNFVRSIDWKSIEKLSQKSGIFIKIIHQSGENNIITDKHEGDNYFGNV